MVSPVPGWTTSRLVFAAIPEHTIIVTERMAKIVAGWGSAFPPRSTIVRKVEVQLFRIARGFTILLRWLCSRYVSE